MTLRRLFVFAPALALLELVAPHVGTPALGVALVFMLARRGRRYVHDVAAKDHDHDR